MEINKKNNEKTYKDEGKHSKFVSNIHFIHDIIHHHPLSVTYLPYWRDIKRKCMEGFWFEGKWMPGPLYFYINLTKIEIDADDYSSTKKVGRPFLRDLEWEKGYVLMEARGFSGFVEDDEISCNHNVKKWNDGGDKDLIKLSPNCFNRKGELKKYVHPREYLRKVHTGNYGKPLFENNASNVIDIECRGSGKSFWGANGMILHTYLMDGLMDYDLYLGGIQSNEPYKADCVVGGIDMKYTRGLLNKFLLGLENLQGYQKLNTDEYKCPLYKKFSGTFFSGKQYIENYYLEKQYDDSWKKKGTGSAVYNVSFKDDPEAGNGKRTPLSIVEEVGFMNNLVDVLASMKDTLYAGPRKYGCLYMFGTGGQMESGASEAAKEVFMNPGDYDCLSFDNIWEETSSIGFFVPYEMGLNSYKDKEGITDLTLAKKFVDAKREPLLKLRSKKQLYKEMQNNPRVPSEAFLISGGNIFPAAELKDHLNWVKSSVDASVKGQNGELVWVTTGEELKLKWKPDLENKLRPCGYRMKSDDDTNGCIQIWEHPEEINGEVPFGLYFAGTDPYDQDKAEASASLGSTFIYKTFYVHGKGVCDTVVAEYTARPESAMEHHENVRKLLLYYNARDLYENERNTLKMHFEHKNSLYLLNRTPTILKSTQNSAVNRSYGTHMTEGIKTELEIYTRDHLLKDAGDGKLNLHKIYSVGLLEELINYNRDGNFDRVIAFMLVICNTLQHHRMRVQEVTEAAKQIDPFFARTKNFFR